MVESRPRQGTRIALQESAREHLQKMLCGDRGIDEAVEAFVHSQEAIAFAQPTLGSRITLPVFACGFPALSAHEGFQPGLLVPCSW
jgi:hypothetical protein